MELITKEEKWGFDFYQLKDATSTYLAEGIFSRRIPHPRLLYSLIKGVEEKIKRLQPLNHPALIKYIEVKQIEGEYCLISDQEERLQPLITYLQEEQPALSRIADWCLTLAEIAALAEKNKINWSGFSLDALRVDSKGQIKLLDPDIINSIKQYNKAVSLWPAELYYPPEVFQNKQWDEQARLYSLGAVFYYLLTGKPPFTAEEKADLIDQILNTTPIEPLYHNHRISPGLNRLLNSLLSKQREQRLTGFEQVILALQEMKSAATIEASPEEWDQAKNRSVRMIKSSRRKLGVRNFFRKKWLAIAIPLITLTVFLIVGFIGGSEPVVTKDSSELEVTQLFYQAIAQKDIILLQETTSLDLKRLEKLVSEVHVIERMRLAYSIGQANEEGTDDQVFGIEDLKLSKLETEPQPVFKASYLFYLNQEDGRQEKTMEDMIKLGKVEGIWQIVGLAGDIELMIEGELEQALE